MTAKRKQTGLRLLPETLAKLDELRDHLADVYKRAVQRGHLQPDAYRDPTRSEAVALAADVATQMLRTDPDGKPALMAFERRALTERLTGIIADQVARAVAEREFVEPETAAAMVSKINVAQVEAELEKLQLEAMND